ncbi:MAG: LacI family transcriptional regulator [Pseudomonadota bacterium]
MTDPSNTAKKPRPTLKTIAYMTGLGVTTVSRALADAPDIGTKTKERVRAVARDIGYRPNRAGVRLRTGKTHVISFILNLEREVLGSTIHLIQGLSRGLGGTPYHLIVTPSTPEREDLSAVRYVVETGSADGIILSGIEPQDPRAAFLHSQKFPFVTHGRPGLGQPTACVDFDNEAFALRATQKLHALGRSRLAIIAPPQKYAYAKHMLDGFHTVLDAHDLMEIPLRDITSEDPRAQIIDEVARILQSRHRPDGIVCATVMSTIAAVTAIEAAGLTVGEDIDIVAKEPYDFLRSLRGAIHVIHEDLFQAGWDMAQTMLKLLEGAAPETLQILHAPDTPDGG